MNHGFDVVVIGEILVELSTTASPGTEPFASGSSLTLGFSGDVLNAAAAAAAAGAHTTVLSRIADDELGHQIVSRLVELGIDTSLLRMVPGQQGVYFVHSDPGGNREFVYSRRGSAGSGLTPQDVIDARLEDAKVVLSSGITCAISDSAAAAVLEAAQRSPTFLYDPNFRPRLTTPQQAAEALKQLAPYAALVTPACPGETQTLLGVSDPQTAARQLRVLGARAVAVTRGADGIVLDDGSGIHVIPAVPAPALVDQTGAGDSLVGTVAGRLALGDSMVDAVRLGSASSSLSLQGQGGTGFVASLAQTRQHLEQFAPAATSVSHQR